MPSASYESRGQLVDNDFIVTPEFFTNVACYLRTTHRGFIYLNPEYQTVRYRENEKTHHTVQHRPKFEYHLQDKYRGKQTRTASYRTAYLRRNTV